MAKDHNKGNRKGLVLIGGIVLAVLALPVSILSYVLYFAWDDQRSGEFYKPAFEKDGKLYDLKMQGNSLAFDAAGTREDHLYLNSPYVLGELIALGYGDYEIGKTDNPYFAGAIAYRNKYHESEIKYRNPKESFQSYKYFDWDRNPIFAYEPETESEFVVKLRPTFPAFTKRSYGIGNKRDYLDATKILKAKLDKNLRLRIDEANKLLVIRFE
jgi:hypothetical protein